MLVFFTLGNAKVLSFALGETKVPNANGFASQWNIGFIFVDNRVFFFFNSYVVYTCTSLPMFT